MFASKESAKPKNWSYLKTSILSLSTLLSKDETTSCPSTEAKSWGAESSNMEVILRDPRLDDAGYILYFEFPMTRLKTNSNYWISYKQVLSLYSNPDISYSSVPEFLKLIKNTSVSHTVALGDTFLHYHEHTHTHTVVYAELIPHTQ